MRERNSKTNEKTNRFNVNYLDSEQFTLVESENKNEDTKDDEMIINVSRNVSFYQFLYILNI